MFIASKHVCLMQASNTMRDLINVLQLQLKYNAVYENNISDAAVHRALVTRNIYLST